MRYERPDTLSEALALHAEGGLRIAAGCTDLFAATERKTLPGDVLDITGLSELKGVAETAASIRIGAAARWADIARMQGPPGLAALKAAAIEVGGPQIQNAGTIGGNLCNASPAADGAPPLLILDAEVELASRRGRRHLALSEFLLGPRKTALQQDEILTAILIPKASASAPSTWLKLGARDSLVISIVMVAAKLEVRGARITGAALAVGAAGPVATRLPEVEAALTGETLDTAEIDDAMVAAALSPIDDPRADARYRAKAAAEALRRALAQLHPSRDRAA